MGICEIHRRRFLPIRKLVPDELFFTHIETGRIGETYGAEYLEQEGYEILDRNYRTRFGEIDIIARDSGDLVFVEVKTRTSEQYGLPEEAVDKRKQQKLIRMALTYVADEGYDGDYRIDVLAIEVENNRPKRVELFKHAVNQV
jgi:putative endonuclease